MSLFRVDANLLSPGAIDFGILIDGAVVVVEYVVLPNEQKISRLERGMPKKRRWTMLVIEEFQSNDETPPFLVRSSF